MVGVTNAGSVGTCRSSGNPGPPPSKTSSVPTTGVGRGGGVDILACPVIGVEGRGSGSPTDGPVEGAGTTPCVRGTVAVGGVMGIVVMPRGSGVGAVEGGPTLRSGGNVVPGTRPMGGIVTGGGGVNGIVPCPSLNGSRAVMGSVALVYGSGGPIGPAVPGG